MIGNIHYVINITKDHDLLIERKGNNEIMNEALKKLKSLITESNILKSILPDNFTMPELQKVFESILQKKFDRRNFRKQTDPYAVLTPEIKKDTKDAFIKVINQVLHPNICTPDGC